MRIGVISDTHIPNRADKIPEAVCEDFKKVDMILHAGDFVELSVLEKLKTLAPVKAVIGNMDHPEVVNLLSKKEIIEAGNFKIGLIHGYGPPFGLQERIKKEFTGKVDIIVYGHSHRAVKEMKDGILFFNPGSVTDKVFSPYNSYGIIEINDKIAAKIIKL